MKPMRPRHPKPRDGRCWFIRVSSMAAGRWVGSGLVLDRTLDQPDELVGDRLVHLLLDMAEGPQDPADEREGPRDLPAEAHVAGDGCDGPGDVGRQEPPALRRDRRHALEE